MKFLTQRFFEWNAMFLALALGLSASNAWSFNIGPYHLGMSNKEAAKISLHSCKEVIKIYIECQGGLKVSGEYTLMLTFDKKSSKLMMLEGYFISETNEAALAKLLDELKIAPCRPLFGEDLAGLQSCYSRPLNVRVIGPVTHRQTRRFRYPPQYRIATRSGSGAAKVFFTSQSDEKKKATVIRKFQEGR